MVELIDIIDTRVEGSKYSIVADLRVPDIERLVVDRLRMLQTSDRIKGFRPGKAPLKLIRLRHGTEITNDVVGKLAVDMARRIIIEKNLHPVGRPTVKIEEPTENAENQRLTLSLEVMPIVALKPIEDIRITRLKPIVPCRRKKQGNDDEDKRRADLGWLEELSEMHVKRQVFDQLSLQYDFSVPEKMVQNEFLQITMTMDAQLGQDLTPELERSIRDIAERRIRLAIVLVCIGREFDIEVPRDEVERLVEAEAQLSPHSSREVIEYYLDHPTALAELQSPVFEDRVVNFIVSKAQCEDRQVSADELAALCAAN